MDLRIIFLSFYECTLCGGDTVRWWGTLKTYHMLKNSFEFIALKDGGNTRTLGTSTHALAPTPRDCSHEPPGETFLPKILTISHLQEFNHN